MTNDASAELLAIDERVSPLDEKTVASEGGLDDRSREEALIRRCIGGDRESFRPLVERYSPSLHVFVVRYVGRSDDCRDIVQEAFLRAYRALPDFDPRYRFSTWLYRIALNICRDHRKKARAMPSGHSVPIDVEEQKVEDPIEKRLDDRRRCEALLALVDDLPPKYREPLLLKDVQRMDYERMSAITGMSVGLLKVRVMRARRRLAGLVRSRELAGHGREMEP